MIRVGTCSWTEKSLIKSKEFYPPTVKTAEERLRYYASRFPTVEVDSAYYSIPDKRTTLLWAKRTPPGFVFHVKVYGAMTGHAVLAQTIPKDLSGLFNPEELEKKRVYVREARALRALSERFVEALSPLREARKLGLLVFQYPPWFRWGQRNLDYILFCRDSVAGSAMAVEFRHGSWLVPERREEVLAFLEKNFITYVTADEPWFESLATVPFLPAATTDTVYMRLHGRNRANWLKRGVETSLRYSYLYSTDELKGFAEALKKLQEEGNTGKGVKKVYIMFNNCHGGFAMRNALEMLELAGG